MTEKAEQIKSRPLLRVEELRVRFESADGVVQAVDGISFDLAPGESLGIVGESGSGKSVSNLAVMGLLPGTRCVVDAKRLEFDGRDLRELGAEGFRQLRGSEIAMVFQDPMTTLNPFMKISDQMAEVLESHTDLSRKVIRQRSIEMLEKVGIVDAHQRIDCYPHEFSGGMRQRVLIATALLGDPKLLIADEPTTALDVTTQAQILDLIRSIREEREMAMILVTHDLGVVAEVVDRVLVMNGGHLMEEAPTAQLFQEPSHPYTRDLLNCIPRLDGSVSWLGETAGESTSPEQVSTESASPVLVQVEGLNKRFPGRNQGWGSRGDDIHAVKNVSMEIRKGETLGLVGESGSGKSTLGRCILQLIRPTSGSVVFRGEELTDLKGSELRKMRRHMQVVFQDPLASLNPRMRIRQILEEPLLIHKNMESDERRSRVVELLDLVGLGGEVMERYPHEFSGGQQQRVGIARALAVEPEFLVCDEAISALDVSIQAQVMRLLKDLQGQLGLTYLFIAHDLSAVRQISDRIAVMYRGEIVETGEAEQVCSSPQDSYTQSLLSAVPSRWLDWM